MVCAILIADGLAGSPEEARRMVEKQRPGGRPNKRQWRALDAWYKQRTAGSGGRRAEAKAPAGAEGSC